MVYPKQGEFRPNRPDASIDYATKLYELFSKGDIINEEIDETLDEAFRDNATKILLLRKQISNINSTQKSSNSIDSKLEEYNLVHFKLQKISRIRAFLIQAKSENFINLKRENKLGNVVKNITTMVTFQGSDPSKRFDKGSDLYDNIYLNLFNKYCNIYQEIKKEQKERSENKPDGLRSGVLSPSTVYGHPLCSVTLPSAPSTQPRVRGEGVRCGGIMPLIEYYRKLSEEGANGVKPLIEYYNKLSEGR